MKNNNIHLQSESSLNCLIKLITINNIEFNERKLIKMATLKLYVKIFYLL